MYNVTIKSSTGEALQSIEIESRSEAMQWLKDNMEPGQDFDMDKLPSPCRECGELCESRWSSYCKSCEFSLDLAVKAARKIIRSAKRHGNPVIAVWDGEDEVKGKESELLAAVHSVDFSRLILESGAQVALVSGNESEADSVPDYNVSLEAIIEDSNLRDED